MGTRRDFLKKAMLLTGFAGVSGVVPGSVQRAFAVNPDKGTSYLDAEHIVILMQENRSFDHELGTLQGVRGFNDPRAVRLPNGNSVFLQTSGKTGETYAPWRLDIKDTRATWLGSIPHVRYSQVDAWNGGNYNNWIDAKRSHHKDYAKVPLTMGHYTREDLPFYYALADAFTVCDQNYCGVMSSTTPNRIVFWTGTVRDRQSPDSKVFIQNWEITDGDMVWGTFPERLQDAGISWKFYQNDLTASGGMTEEERRWLGNFGLNVLEDFRNYHVELTPRYGEKMREKMAAVREEITQLRSSLRQQAPGSEQAELLQLKLKMARMQLAKFREKYRRSEGNLAQLSASARELHERAFVTNQGDPDFHALEVLDFQDGPAMDQMKVPKGDAFYQFRKDVEAGKLPTISWLAAPENFSDHPVSPWYGAWYVSEAMDILTKNPEVWKKTIFILTYDENDGYFDHCPSFAAPDPRREDTGGVSKGIDYTGLEYTYAKDDIRQGMPPRETRTGPIGLGFRVPMIIASPWSRGGWVDSQLFDHSSTIQFLEQFVEQKYGKRVRETNISPWRRAICGDLTSAFRPYDGGEPKLPFLNRNQHVEAIQCARYKEIPADYKALDPAEVQKLNGEPRSFAVQERGIRRACAIPYDLHVNGRLDPGRTSFEVSMTVADQSFGESAAGAPFNVYLYGTKESSASTAHNLSHPNMMAATYAVKAGDTLVKMFSLSRFTSGRYDIAVHGPNGFFREFQGGSDDPAIAICCGYQVHNVRLGQSGSELMLRIRPLGGVGDLTVRVHNYYSSKDVVKNIRQRDSAGLVTLNLDKQHGWYDVSVTINGFQRFGQRYAGHIETGRPSYTDPVMGGVWESA